LAFVGFQPTNHFPFRLPLIKDIIIYLLLPVRVVRCLQTNEGERSEQTKTVLQSERLTKNIKP
ncbi:MAG TPA: hypothetical protein PLE56_03630, partial [Chitinophagales bacterium]|nr:hypothetical protein [Chitinophagales bacterium]